MDDIVKAPVFVVKITAVRVRIPIVPERKIDIGMIPPPPPPTEGGPTILTGPAWKTSKMIAETKNTKNVCGGGNIIKVFYHECAKWPY